MNQELTTISEHDKFVSFLEDTKGTLIKAIVQTPSYSSPTLLKVLFNSENNGLLHFVGYDPSNEELTHPPVYAIRASKGVLELGRDGIIHSVKGRPRITKIVPSDNNYQIYAGELNSIRTGSAK